MARGRADMLHHRPRLAGDLMLATRTATATLLRRHPDQISRHAEPVACDVATKQVLYDVDETARIVSQRRRRVA
jgi:hypothetical protein